MDRVDFEELALKSIDTTQLTKLQRFSTEVEEKDEISVRLLLLYIH